MDNETLYYILAGVLGLFAAAALGANDAANSLSTSVGAKCITLGQALVIGVVFESLGTFCGGSVISTIRKGIVDISDYSDKPQEFVWGMLAALVASTIWLFLATAVSMPVSTTHAIVGSMAGFGIIANGFDSIKWGTFGSIALSWVISPLASAILTIIVYWTIEVLVLERKDQARASQVWVPVYAFGIGFLLAWVTMKKGLKDIGLDMSDALIYSVSFALGLAVAVANWFFVRKHIRNEGAFNDFQLFEHDRALNSDVLMDVAHSASLAVRLGRKPNRNMLHGGMDRNSREFQEEAGELNDECEYKNVTRSMRTLNARAQRILKKHPHIVVASTAAAAAAATAMDCDADIQKLSLVTAAATTYAVTATTNALAAGVLGSDLVDSESEGEKEEEKESGDVAVEVEGELSDAPVESPYEIAIDTDDIKVGRGSNAAEAEEKDESIPDDVSSFFSVVEENKEELKDNVPVPILKAFNTLMVLSAITQAFSHAANNVGNVLAPVIGVLSTVEHDSVQDEAPVPLWTLILAAVGISAGLLLYGHKVIETVGSKIADLTSPTAFAVTLSASLTVVFASLLGFPISSTHVLVGSVTAIAFYRGGKAPDSALLKNIALTWVVTCPAGAVLAALFYVAFRAIF